MDLLKPNERIDYMYNDDLQIIQEKDAFSFSLDTLLLGYFAQNKVVKTFGNYIFSNNVINWKNMFSNATNLVSLGIQDMSSVTDLTGAFLRKFPSSD